MPAKVEIIDKDKGMKAIVARLNEAKGSYVEAGWWNDATIPAAHEFGTRKIPERPFLRPAIDRNREKYRNWTRKIALAVIDGVRGVREGLTSLGDEIVKDIQRQIDEVTSPPLAPSTIKQRRKKGRGTKPLVSTGEMRRSCSRRVVIKK